MSDVTLSRLFRHMAWANNQLFTQLSILPENSLKFTAWNPEWSVGKIANHIVIAQGRFISRLQNLEAFPEHEFELTSEGMAELANQSAANDQKLQEFLNKPDEVLTFLRYGKVVSFLTSSVLAQVIHHATEHRAQIADIMAINNMWRFERFEKSGPER
jgi:uncharacterized damage-inducible protein DinB